MARKIQSTSLRDVRVDLERRLRHYEAFARGPLFGDGGHLQGGPFDDGDRARLELLIATVRKAADGHAAAARSVHAALELAGLVSDRDWLPLMEHDRRRRRTNRAVAGKKRKRRADPLHKQVLALAALYASGPHRLSRAAWIRLQLPAPKPSIRTIQRHLRDT
jgi:hypothetical protein